MIVVAGTHRDADAGRGEHFVATEVERRIKFLFNALRQRRRLARTCDAIEQNRELVAAETRNHVNFADAVLQTARHGNQKLISDCVTEAVVYVLESIEVEEEHGELIVLVLLCPLD